MKYMTPLMVTILLHILAPSHAMVKNATHFRLFEPDTQVIPKALEMHILENCPEQIKSMVNSWQKRHGDGPNKLLLIGPQGAGKTTIGKAIASAYDIPFFRYRAAALITGSKKSRADRLKNIFEKAAALHRPCVIIIDELEAFVVQQNQDLDDTTDMLACLKDELVRYEKHPILFIGTMSEVSTETMPIKNLFSQQTIEIPLPNENQRKNILDYYLNPREGAPFSTAISSSKLAQITEGFSPRELERFIQNIRYKRFSPAYDNRAFTMHDCLQELEEQYKIKRQFTVPAHKRAYQWARLFLKKHNKAVNVIIGITVIVMAYYVLVYDRKSRKKKHPMSKQLLTWQELQPITQSLKGVKLF